MSWELAERLKARFPQVELFPRPDQPEPGVRAPGPAAEGRGADEGGAAPAPERPAVPARRPAHEQPPRYLTPGVYVPRDSLLDVCRVLATDPEFGLTYLSFVSAIDWPERGEMEVLYHLYSHRTREELALKVRVPRDDPRVPSVTGIWDGANWHEREAYDLLGVIFEGHPNLRRIMMTDDWIGHPLRKDYVYQDPPWLVEIARERQKDAEGLGLGERA
ncbi:MAG: NADH-quinone oxidoreductase subunit C [Armatimonadota bacterium]|nr:NADH-quinone oxidoreductase subunit C [Armatimonadota bacterium]